MMIEQLKLKVNEALLRRMETIQNTRIGPMGHQFTPEDDLLILAAYPKKNKDALAKALGCCRQLVYKRYKELLAMSEEELHSRFGNYAVQDRTSKQNVTRRRK